RPEVGFVQAPQDHRDGHQSPFKRMINWEYAGFFNIGMVQRNEDNAIIQHGTMTLIRRAALEGTGRWGQWCIVEDAELGLRMLEAGWESVYVNHSFGHGLSPDSFAGYKRQRFRWAYGAMQILKRHWRALLPWDRTTRLTAAQRYHFVVGWLPWFADALSVVLAVAGLVWTAGLLAFPTYFDFPLTVFLAPTIAVFGFKLVRFLWLYNAKVRCDLADCLRAGIAGLALTYTIGQAMLMGMLTSQKPFLRTPKCENRPALLQGLAMARTEAIMLVLLVAGALAIGLRFGKLDREAWVWSVTLLVLALPYGAAVYTAVRDALPAISLAGLRKPAIGGTANAGSPGSADVRP
ncbi:MAG: glycosyltransferase family 2 protein, partial [Alphaproteobacteria bacterium]